MNIRTLRLARGWSQEHLAQLAGLNIRTIQRVERGQPAGIETLNAIAAVLDVPRHQLQPEDTPMHTETATPTAASAPTRSPAKTRFFAHLANYATIIPLLFGINAFTSPDYWWALWPAMGWGVGLASHAIAVFILGTDGLEFDIDDTPHAPASPSSPEAHRQALIEKRLKDLRDYYRHLAIFVAAMVFMAAVNAVISPSYWWCLLAFFGWGFGVAMHSLSVLVIPHFFGETWEARQRAKLEKRFKP